MDIQFAKRIRLLLFVCALLINFECEAENIPNCLESVNFHAVIIQKSLQLNVDCEFSDPSNLDSSSQSYNLAPDANIRISGCSIPENKTISPLLDSENEQFNIECKAHGVYKIHQVYKFLNLEVEHVLKNLTNERYVSNFLSSYQISRIHDLDQLLKRNGNKTLSFKIDCSIKDLSCTKTNSISTVSTIHLTIITSTIATMLIIIIVMVFFRQKFKILIFGDKPNSFTNVTFNDCA